MRVFLAKWKTKHTPIYNKGYTIKSFIRKLENLQDPLWKPQHQEHRKRELFNAKASFKGRRQSSVWSSPPRWFYKKSITLNGELILGAEISGTDSLSRSYSGTKISKYALISEMGWTTSPSTTPTLRLIFKYYHEQDDTNSVCPWKTQISHCISAWKRNLMSWITHTW